MPELDAKFDELRACQESKYQKSCMQCSDYVDCSLRLEYVKAVYNSMSNGNGGFEF